MPRTSRASIGGICYHVMNRGNGRATVFHQPTDYEDFVALIAKGCSQIPMRVLAYCLMPNHFHLVLWPHGDGDLGRWMQWVTTSHVRRYHSLRGASGHVWQGRFKAFPAQSDNHLLSVMLYVERNPARAGLVSSARQWAWSSARCRGAGSRPDFLVNGPMALFPNWLDMLEAEQPADELESLRNCAERGAPFGSESWVKETAVALGLEFTLRDRGRPRRKRGHSTFSPAQDEITPACERLSAAGRQAVIAGAKK